MIPLVPIDELLFTEGNGVLLSDNRDGTYVPPLVRIGGELRRLVLEEDSGLLNNIQRITPPNNIAREYVGAPGTSITIIPTGAIHLNGLPVDYVFLNEDLDEIELNIAPLVFPVNVGDVDIYHVYATGNGTGPSVEFTLRSVPEVYPEDQFSVSELKYDIPTEVYPGLVSSGEMRYTVNTSPNGEDITLNITDTANIALGKTTGIEAGDSVGYSVNKGGTGDVTITYHYTTPTGKRTSDKQLLIKNNIANGDSLPYDFIDSFPTSVVPGDTFTWRFGNVAPGIELHILSTYNLATGHTGVVSPGEAVLFQVMGDNGDAISITYALVNDSTVIGTYTKSSVIGNPTFDVSGFNYTVSPPESELTTTSPNNIIEVTLTGLEAAASIVMSSPTTDVLVTNLGSTNLGTTYRVRVGPNYDPTVPLVLPVVVRGINDNGFTETSIIEITLTVGRANGSETIKFSRIFTKPAGATTLVINTSGGANYENTILTGLINTVFAGGLTQPAVTSSTHTGLTPDEETITFDLASGVTAWVAWS